MVQSKNSKNSSLQCRGFMTEESGDIRFYMVCLKLLLDFFYLMISATQESNPLTRIVISPDISVRCIVVLS